MNVSPGPGILFPAPGGIQRGCYRQRRMTPQAWFRVE